MSGCDAIGINPPVLQFLRSGIPALDYAAKESADWQARSTTP